METRNHNSPAEQDGATDEPAHLLQNPTPGKQGDAFDVQFSDEQQHDPRTVRIPHEVIAQVLYPIGRRASDRQRTLEELEEDYVASWKRPTVPEVHFREEQPHRRTDPEDSDFSGFRKPPYTHDDIFTTTDPDN